MKSKTFLRTMLLCLSLLAFTNSCEREDEEEEEEVETVSVDPYGSWKRGDGQVAYVKFEGSTAYSCANGVITEGTFNKSDPSMTYVIQGNTIKFPLKFVDTNSLLVGVPDQAINTNNATMYIDPAVSAPHLAAVLAVELLPRAKLCFGYLQI